MKAVPLAMVPEDPCHLRTGAVVTAPVDVEGYDAVLLDCQCSPLAGRGPTFEVLLQESRDRVTWSQVAAPGAPLRPEAGATVRCLGSLERRWLRVRVEWSGVFGAALSPEVPIEIGVDGGRQVLRITLPATRHHPAATLWCSASLERRVA